MIPEGDFSFIKNNDIKIQLENVYNAIHIANAWDYIIEGSRNTSYSMSSDYKIYEITSYINMKLFDRNMFDLIMNEMHKIAYYGWDKWTKLNK